MNTDELNAQALEEYTRYMCDVAKDIKNILKDDTSDKTTDDIFQEMCDLNVTVETPLHDPSTIHRAWIDLAIGGPSVTYMASIDGDSVLKVHWGYTPEVSSDITNLLNDILPSFNIILISYLENQRM